DSRRDALHAIGGPNREPGIIVPYWGRRCESGSKEELISRVLRLGGLDSDQNTSSGGREERRHSASSSTTREQPAMPDRGTYP
ncbi:unnamed protein product, partial [Ectocarpus sp. 12 AP-2014]